MSFAGLPRILANVDPDPNGEIPFEQERRMRKLGLWLFLNGEAIYHARPWTVTKGRRKN